MVTLASALGGGVALVFLIPLGLAIYLIPTIVAAIRKVPNVGSVAVINIFVGWTFIGWVIAMSMAARSQPAGSSVNVHVAQSNQPGVAGTWPGESGPER